MPTQQQNPNPPSLLWAHELRRENIHLINRLDATQAELTSLASTVAELQRTTTHLAEQIATVDNRYEARLDGLRDGFTQRIDLLVQRVEGLERERVRIGGRIDVLEGRCSMDAWGCSGRGVVSWECFGDGGVLQGKRGLDRRTRHSPGEEDSDEDEDGDKTRDDDEVLVPDSFPPDKRYPNKNQPNQNQPNSLEYDYLSSHPHRTPEPRTPDPPTPSPISTVAATASTVTVTTRDSPSPSGIAAVSEQPQAKHLQQGGRPLEDYIRFGESLHAKLPPCKREGDIVERFVKGLCDEWVREAVERRMDCVGWVWERMVGVLREVVAGEGGAAAAGERNGGEKGRGRRTKRRRISIVSPDEEDMLQMAGMHVG